MAITDIRMVEGYAEVSETVLSEKSIIRQISHPDVEGSISEGTQLKVYVHELPSIQNYVAGTGVTQSVDGSAYVTLNNLKDKVVDEGYDGLSVEKVYNKPNYISNRLEGATEAFGEQIDTDGFTKMIADGTVVVGTATVAAGDFIVGTFYKVTAANTAGDATTAGAAASTAVVGEYFRAISDGTGLTTMTVVGAKPQETSIYKDILQLKKALDEAKAPKTDRHLVLTPEMENLLLLPDAKVIIAEPASKFQQVEGAVGRLLGFNIFSTTLVPSGTNMIACHRRGFAHTDDWKVAPFLISLDGTPGRVGDSALKGRMAYNNGAIRPTLIQLNKGAV